MGGVFTGSAFSIRFGVASFFASVSSFAPDFGLGDLSGSGVGLFLASRFLAGSGDTPDSAFFGCFSFEAAASSSSLDFFVPDFAWAFGIGDSSGSGIGVFLEPGFLVDSGDSFDLAFFFRFNLGVASLPFLFGFFIPDFALLLSAGVSSRSGVGLFLAAGVAVGSGESPASAGPVRPALGVASFSSSFDFLVPDFALLFGAGVSSRSGVGLFLAAGVAVAFGFGVGRFLDFALRFAGFGCAAGSGVSTGAGEATTRISSRALMRASRFFASSLVNCALTKVATIALSARAVPREIRKRITAGERSKAEGAINPEGFRGQLAKAFGVKSRKLSESSGLWRRRGGIGGTLPFPAENRIQFSAKEQKQTGQIHPGHQHDDGGQREISGVVAIVPRNIKLEQFCNDDPTNREEDRAGQGLPDRQIIFRGQKVESERQNNQRHRGQRQIQEGDPFLQRDG